MRNIKLFISLLAFAFLVDSCSKDEIVYSEANVEVAKTYLSLDQLVNNPVEVSSEAGTYVLKVVSDKKWKVTSSEEWCTLSTKEGFKYVEVPISFSDNPWNIDRTAQLTFTVSETEESYTLNLKQIAAETKLTADLSELVYRVGGGEQTVSLKTNANDWSLQIIDPNATEAENVSWFTSSVYSGQGSMDIKFTALGNDTEAIRNAKIVFTAEDKTLEIPVEQLEKFDAPVIKLDEAVTFNLTWDKIVGVNYKLKIFNNTEGSETVGLDEEGLTGDAFITQDFTQNTTSCDLSKLGWNDYIGKIKIQLSATMTINGKDITLYSNVIEAHNYFDISSGDGSQNSPYVITEPRHLMNLGVLTEEGIYFEQTKDIDLTDVKYTPVANFANTFDGKNHNISGLTISSGDNVGLFAMIDETGVVKNVVLSNVNITAGSYVGSLAAQSKGTVENCVIESGKVSASGAYVGGLIGDLPSGDGTSTFRIQNCINKANVSSTFSGDALVGGVIGCFNKVTDGKVLKCANYGDVTAIKGKYVGGIIGRSFNNPNMEECFNKGSISGNEVVGGVIGQGNVIMIVNCYNVGSVISTTGEKVSGIEGAANNSNTTIQNCYNVGQTQNKSGNGGYGITYGGGNSNSKSAVISCYCLNGTAQSIGKNVQEGGIMEEESAMKQQATYTNWDFNTVWTMSSETGYPKLQWEN